MCEENPDIPFAYTEGSALDEVLGILMQLTPAQSWRVLVHARLKHLHDFPKLPRDGALEEDA